LRSAEVQRRLEVLMSLEPPTVQRHPAPVRLDKRTLGKERPQVAGKDVDIGGGQGGIGAGRKRGDSFDWLGLGEARLLDWWTGGSMSDVSQDLPIDLTSKEAAIRLMAAQRLAKEAQPP
jgi:hypothetical protein